MRTPLRLALLLLLTSCAETPQQTVVLATDAGAGACGSSAECDDRIPCTRDLCVVGGVCEHVPDNAVCTAPQVCTVGVGCAAPGARRCTRTSDCEDNVPCTRDTCLVDGTCRNAPQDDQCPTGQRCLATGCGTGTTPGACRTPTDCDDHFECTEDTCNATGQCIYVAQNARCGAGRVCRAGMGCVSERQCSSDADCDNHLRCDGVERCSELACIAGTPVACDDGMACTVDACVEGDAGTCTHTMDPTCMSMAGRSGLYRLAPAIQYSCPGFLMLNLQDMQFTRAGGRLTVTGGPVPMTGAAPSGMAFSVEGQRGMGLDCIEIYRLEGNFTDETHFAATLSFTYPAVLRGLCGAVCPEQSWMVRGELQP